MPGPARGDEAPGADAPGVRILHLEDNDADAELIVSMLRAEGLECAVTRVQTRDAFLAGLEDSRLDLILSDYTLPSFRGLAALGEARTRRPDLPFVFVSGTIGEESAIEALQEGATDYVLKQRLSRLVPAVRRALEEQAARRARERAEGELKRQGEALAQTEKLAAMGCLLAGVAHELNNPLAVIVGQTELLQRRLQGREAERAAKIAVAAQRCARIVKNFLALARQRPPERQRISLKPVIEEAVELVTYSLRADGVEVGFDTPEDLPWLWADPHQLHQVVVNLVTNAQHALRGTAPPRRLQLRVRCPRPDRVRLEVADNGPGIPPAIRSRVFEPFFTTKAAGEGTGLGLSLCRGIVEGHGGTITLDSTPGQGTVFQIELPVPPQAERGSERPEAAAETAPTPPRRVLVVDDEPELAAMLAEMLSADGHLAETAGSGTQALDKLGREPYDLVISDVRMPEMDGPALYSEAARLHPRLERRFVFLTGDVLAPATLDFLERARLPSLDKPFSAEEVRRVVRVALEGAPPAPRA